MEYGVIGSIGRGSQTDKTPAAKAVYRSIILIMTFGVDFYQSNLSSFYSDNLGNFLRRLARFSLDWHLHRRLLYLLPLCDNCSVKFALGRHCSSMKSGAAFWKI